MGPPLFMLYVNDLLTGIRDGIIIYSADDTAVIPTIKSWSGVESKLNDYLKSILKRNHDTLSLNNK